jgi:hypothetical protein
MSFVEKFQYLRNTKWLLREAISAIGGRVSTSDTFRSFRKEILKDEATLILDFDRDLYGIGATSQTRNDTAGFSDIVTFTRSTGGGRFNQFGMYEWVGNDVPRFDHDPATLTTSASSVTIGYGEKRFHTTGQYALGESIVVSYDANNYMIGTVILSSASTVTLNVVTVVGSGTYSAWTLIVRLGLLVEESRTNRLTYSEFQNGLADAPVRFNVTASVTPDFNPLGTTSCIVYPYTPTSNTYAYKQFSATSGTPYTFSCLVVMEDGGVPVIAESSTDASGDFRVVVDSSNVLIYSKVEHVCGNVYKVIGHKIGEATGTRNYGLYKAMGNSTRGFKVTGYQLEVGTFPTSYIQTTGTAITRASELSYTKTMEWFNADGGTVYQHVDFTDGQTQTTGRVYPAILKSSVDATSSAYTLGLYNFARMIKGNPAPTAIDPLGTFDGAMGNDVTDPIKVVYTYDDDGLVTGTANVGAPRPPIDMGCDLSLTTRLGIVQANNYSGHIKSIRYIPRRLGSLEIDDAIATMSTEFTEEKYSLNGIGGSSVSDVMTFTRSTGGGRFNELGYYEWVGTTDTPRIDHDPSTVGTSTDSITMSIGAKTINTTRQYTAGDVISIAYDASNYMIARVRHATATVVNVDVLKVVGSGTYSDWRMVVRKGVMVEEGRTNLLPNSKPITYGFGVATKEDEVGISGSIGSAVKVTQVGTGAEYSNLTISVSTTTTYTTSVYVAKQANAYSARISIGLLRAPAASVYRADLRLNPTDGSLFRASGLAPATVSDAGDWWRVTATIVPDGVISTMQLYVEASSARTPGQYNTFDAFQIEAGTSATSYIPTAGTAVTRSYDSLYRTIGSEIDWNEGTVTMDMSIDSIPPQLYRLLSFSSGSADDRITMFNSNGNFGFDCAVGGVTSVSYDSGVSMTTGKHKIGLSWCRTLGILKIAINGVVTTVDGAVLDPSIFGQVWFGQRGYSALGAIVNSSFENIRFSKSIMIDDELSVITS